MSRRARTYVRVVAVVTALAATGSAAGASERFSVNSCQNAVKTQAASFLRKRVTAVDRCLLMISRQIIQNNAPNADGAAATCITQFRSIYDTRGAGKSLPEKLSAGITRACTGSPPLTLADILGPGASAGVQPINANNIARWCAHFGGNGTITTLNGWIDCIPASHACA